MTERVVQRAYRYRLYPTPQQDEQLAKTFGCVRYVYNRALSERVQIWTQEHRTVTFAETSRWLTAWKRDPETSWLAEPSKGPLQAALRNLQEAYSNFWAKRAKFPKFKRKGKSRESATYFRGSFKIRDGVLTLAKMADPLMVVWSRPLPDGVEPSQVTVSRDRQGRYHVSVLVQVTVQALAPTGTAVGLDAGITSLATLSTGEKIVNPRHEKRDEVRLRRAQRSLSRKQKGSASQAKAKLRVARIHGKIADRRRDGLHKLTTRLIREHDTIAIENLAVRNMIKNHSLARAISDVAWSELRRQLEYKADWYGRTVIVIDRWYPSSKTCSACGVITEKLPLQVREWTCMCGAVHDRDLNAAINILAVGLAERLNASGAGVSPLRV